jgi:hypothetical protein
VTGTSPRPHRERQRRRASPPQILSPCAAQATGPPLRPQGSLPRSLRDGLRPPLTPEPLRAPGRKRRGQASGLAPPGARRTTHKITQTARSAYSKSLRFEGIARVPPVRAGPEVPCHSPSSGMPTGHARTAALLRSGHPGDLPVRRGHLVPLALAARPAGGRWARHFRGRPAGTGRQPACPDGACPRVKHLPSGPGGAALNK